VAVAAGAGFAGFSSWVIAGLVFAAWVIVALSERKLSGPWTMKTVARHHRSPDAGKGLGEHSLPKVEYAPVDEFPLEPELSSVVRVTRVAPVEEPAPVAPPPRRRVVSRKPRPTPAAMETQWNVWTLEEVVRENAPGNDELVYLTVSLRDFADANGLLPVGFDPLVRESFGSLLPLAG
jgi:hypothetical protein